MSLVEIDIDRLRKDLEDYYMSGFVVTGFGEAFMEATDVKNASDDEIIEMAQKASFELRKYII